MPPAQLLPPPPLPFSLTPVPPLPTIRRKAISLCYTDCKGQTVLLLVDALINIDKVKLHPVEW
jgi:hypothetical protein